jgi:hypothetical protein
MKNKFIGGVVALLVVAIIVTVAVRSLSTNSPTESNLGHTNFVGAAAICSAPLTGKTQGSDSGDLMAVGDYKNGMTSRRISSFEFDQLGESLSHCITYFTNPSGSPDVVKIYGNPKQIRKYQSYVLYYLSKSGRFQSVSRG